MNMEVSIIYGTYVLLLSFCIFLIWVYHNSISKGNWFNGKAVYKDSKIKEIEFEIREIKLTFDSENNEIAQYTAVACFFNKEGNKDWNYNRFVFFDKVGKYTFRDKLGLIKINS